MLTLGAVFIFIAIMAAVIWFEFGSPAAGKGPFRVLFYLIFALGLLTMIVAIPQQCSQTPAPVVRQ